MLNQLDDPRTRQYPWCVHCRRTPGRDHRVHVSEMACFPLLGGDYLHCDFVAVFPCLTLMLQEDFNTGAVELDLFLCVPKSDGDVFRVSLLRQMEESTLYEAEMPLSPDDAAQLLDHLWAIRNERMSFPIGRETRTYRGTTWGLLEVAPAGTHAATLALVRAGHDRMHWVGPDGTDRLEVHLDERDLDATISALRKLVGQATQPAAVAAA